MTRPLGLRSLALALVPFGALLVSCGGGASGGGGGPPSIGSVTRIFPPYDALTDAATIVVRGSATSPDAIAGVTVAGVPATSGDGFANWTAAVPLTIGSNTLDVDATTGLGGALTAGSVVVTREDVVFSELGSSVYDPIGDESYVLETRGSRLLRLSAGASSVLASATVGTGESLFNLTGLAVDLSTNTAYGARPNSGASLVLAIDLTTGNRTVVTGNGTGSGVALQSAGDATFDPATGRYYLLDPTAATLVEVDVATGARSTVSGAGVGAGPALPVNTLIRIAPDFGAGRVLVATNVELFAVSVGSGDRTLLSGPSLGTGPSLACVGLAVDAATNRAFVSRNATPLEILTVDLATGNRTPLPHPAAPAGGPDASAWFDLEFDAAGDRLLGPDYGGAALRAVSLTTGVRTDVVRPARGGGAESTQARGIGLVDDAHAVVLDGSIGNALIRVDLSTGDRSLLQGTGPTLGVPARAMTIDPIGGRALVAALMLAGFGVVAVDLQTGNRTVVSEGGPAGGTILAPVRALDTDGVTAWLTTESASILSLDLATGLRTVLSDSVTGAGPAFGATYGVVGSPASGLIYVGAYAAGDHGLYSVSLATGDRAPVSTGLVGSGPNLSSAAALQREAGGATLVGATTLDGTNPGVTRYVLGSGTRAIVSNEAQNPGLGATTLMSYLARPRADGILIGVDDHTNSVLAIDPVTGERVVLSR